MKTSTSVKNVAFFGSKDGVAGELLFDAMLETGRILAQQNVIVICRGYYGSGGQAPAEGAWLAGGEPVGFIASKVFGPGNPRLAHCQDYSLIELAEHGGTSRTSSEMACLMQRGRMLEADSFIFGAGGEQNAGAAFLEYLDLSVNVWLKEKKSKRAAILCTPRSNGLWGHMMLHTLKRWGFLSPLVEPFIRVIHTPRGAVDWVLHGK